MSWEQSALSFEQQQPPTPSRTPTSSSFGDVFRTPKFESSFYDPRVTWNTADPNANSPSLLRTPRPLSFESKNVAAPSPANLSRNLEAEFFANAQHILATPDFSSLQVDHQIDVAPTPQSLSQGENLAPAQPDLPLESSSSFRSASNIQTPPPTTTSASKKQGKKVQIQEAEKKSNGSESRRKSAPLLPRPSKDAAAAAATQGSPNQFAGLEFSPNIFGPEFMAPATAPIHSQQKVFWEPEATNDMNLDFSDLSNPFGTPRQGGLDPFVSNHPSISNSQTTMQDSFLDFGNDVTPVASFSQPNFGLDTAQSNGLQMTSRSMHGVDPSLLFSSPSKISDTINSAIPPGKSVNEESLQPYAYQVQEARREKAYGGISKPKKRRKPSVDSPAVKAAMETLREDGDKRPAVRRSMTDSAVSRYGHESGSSRTSSAHGRSSPLKSIRENRKAGRRPKHRTSIALTIDENGRARAEARVIGAFGKEVPEDAMDIDSISESSETESGSSSDQSNDEMVTSFATQHPGPKMGRFGSSVSHSQKSSYTSFVSSTGYQDNPASLPEITKRPVSGSFANSRTGGPHSSRPHKKGHRIPEGPESEAETVLDSDADEDNAQNQIRKVVQSQRRKSGPQPKHHLYSPLGISTAVFGDEHAVSSISPTTMTDPDLPTPSSGTSSTSESIRCLCHSNTDKGQMIQCESCKKWLHVPCTGLNPQRLPKIYLCLFCTGQTPAVRGGRVRDPRRYVAPNSPLAQKSSRFQ